MTIIKEGKFLSDLIGAHSISDFITEVRQVSPSSPALVRGSVVCKLADGTMTLAGSQATTPDTVYGIVLEHFVDPTAPDAFASIGRSGVYNATQLVVDAGKDLNDFEEKLRNKGIFLEQLSLWARPSQTHRSCTTSRIKA